MQTNMKKTDNRIEKQTSNLKRNCTKRCPNRHYKYKNLFNLTSNQVNSN